MLNTRLYRLINDQRLSMPILSRCFHHEFSNKDPLKMPDDENSKKDLNQKELKQQDQLFSASKSTIPSVQQKYEIFRDEDATEIFDVEEERHRYQQKDIINESEIVEQLCVLNLERGLHGVFDIEDLVAVLRKENAVDIFVCAVSRDIKYVEHMVFCTGRSYRHMLSMAEFVRRTYKNIRRKNDILPKIEGETSRDWMALDLGNIALHIFSAKARKLYDLESLWAIGADFDKEYNKPKNPLVELFEANTHQFIKHNNVKQ